jgi:hypothetical protein
MSLETDITGIKETLDLKEGYARAKELYVDTGKINIRQLNTLSGKDPTPQKKYIEWMARMYIKGHRNIRQYHEIAVFDDLVNRNQVEEPDINKYKTMEEVSDAIRQAQRKIEQKKAEKKFTIDTEVLSLVDPADIAFQNDKVMVVKPLTTENSQTYGRNHRCKKGDPNSATAYWCTSTTTGYNRFMSYFQNSGDTFYIILPKTIDVVPEEKFTKVNVQVAPAPRGGGRTVWDFFDHTMDEAEATKLFKMWGIPFKKPTKKED